MFFLFFQMMLYLNSECFFQFKYFYDFCPHVFFVGSPFIFLVGPSLFLYIKSIAFSDFKLENKHIIHIVPFIFAVLYFTVIYHVNSAEEKRILLSSKLFFPDSSQKYYSIISHVQILIYNLSAFVIVKNYRGAIRQQYSSIQRINLSWLNFVLYGYLIAWLTSVSTMLFRFYDLSFIDIMRIINYLSFFIFFNYIFYKALIQPELFSGIEEKQKYSFSRLKKEEAYQYLDRLTAYMSEKKPFIDPEITLKNLADQLSIQPRYLSQIINEYLHQNFFDFIGSYRIEETKRMLQESNNKKTISEILYQVGFNSKSTFNAAFKKFTGMTPKRYKKLN
jgi:AraC-like DNA-binding protein